MKLFLKNMSGLLRLILMAALICPFADARAATVGFNVNPSSITNDYVGKITFSITNATSGGTVTVEQYADLNGNGIIDTSEPLVLSLKVADGQVARIGGIRNLNVPGDEDGMTNSQIRVELFFPSVSVAFGAALKSIFKVTDPSNGSSTQPFNVSQKIYPQGVRGRITAAATGLPLTNTIVALESVNFPAVFASETDPNGNYAFYTPPGTYRVVPVKNGFVIDHSVQVIVGCNQFVTNNLALAAANLTISGKISDSVSGAGIPGLFVDARSTNDLRAGAFADTNGNYSLQVTASNIWSVRPDRLGPAQLGYVPPAHRVDVNVTNSNVSNINFPFPKATALIYGTIKDDQSNPLIGVAFSGQDLLPRATQHEADGRSVVSNANYCLGVIAGTWTVGNEFALLGYPGQATNVIVTAGQATNVNFVVGRSNFPSLGAPTRLSNSQFQFLLNGTARLTYTIQASTNLNSPNWLCLLVTNAASNTISIVDSQATNRARFYRALLGP